MDDLVDGNIDDGHPRWVELDGELPLSARVRGYSTTVDERWERADVIGLLLTVPEFAGAFHIEREPSGDDVVLPQLVGRTRIFVDRRRLTDLQWDAGTFVAVWALAHSATFSAAATLFQKALRTVRVLNDDELDMAIVISAVCGGNPYERPVTERTLVGAYDGDHRRVDSVLTAMRRRGIVERTGDSWRLVR